MARRKVLITGASGFIGRHLVAFLKSRYDLLLFDKKPFGEKGIDIISFETVREVIRQSHPEFIIHLAGIKNLNYCETHPEETFLINTYATQNIAEIAEEIGARLLFISSDYVFDGEIGNYRETDRPNPVTVYGKSKAEAESVIQHTCRNFVILRTSAVYGYGGNFFDWVLKSLQEGKTIDTFVDTYFTPTYIGDVVEVFEQLIEENLKGILHVAGTPVVSRYEMAREIGHRLKKDPTLVRASNVAESEMLIARNSSLNCEFTKSLLKRCFLSLPEGLDRLGLSY